jgi:hypothetical protein
MERVLKTDEQLGEVAHGADLKKKKRDVKAIINIGVPLTFLNMTRAPRSFLTPISHYK